MQILGSGRNAGGYEAMYSQISIVTWRRGRKVLEITKKAPSGVAAQVTPGHIRAAQPETIAGCALDACVTAYMSQRSMERVWLKVVLIATVEPQLPAG